MRIWDLDPGLLCRKHLLGEHRELHAIWNILTQDKRGYRNHPETRRWEGRLFALHQRHLALCEEMVRRGWCHRSPLVVPVELADDGLPQDRFVNTVEEQRALLRQKGCECDV